jgi:hypothetical protein
MRLYKIIARILPILPIINFAFALPVAVQGTCRVCNDVVPDVAITTSTKRADEMEKLRGMYFDPERLSGNPESDLTGLKGLLPPEPSRPELPKSPSFDHYLASSDSEASLSHYLTSTDSELGSSQSAASGSGRRLTSSPILIKNPNFKSGSGRLMTSSPMENPESKSFLSKALSKIKFWRRISGPGSVRDTVNAAQRRLQGLLDTGTYVSASSP